MDSPSFMEYFVEEKKISTNQNKEITILHINIDKEEKVLNEWAKHLRTHYCTDEELYEDSVAVGKSYSDFLSNLKFPDPNIGLGAATMSGDFSEILIADYIEYILNYIVPRIRYRNKFNRNSSTQGSDLIAYKVTNIDNPNQNDEMLVVEVKAKNSESKPENTLQNAVNHSKKDIVRIAESLNAAHRVSIYYEEKENAEIIRRFQNPTDNPYKRIFVAAAVHSDTSFSEELLRTVDITEHPENKDLLLIAVHSPVFLSFIKEMYVRASNEN